MLNWLCHLLGLKNGSGIPRKQYRIKSNPEDRTLSKKLDDNKKVLQEIFDRCDDLVMREIMIGKENPVRALAVFFDPLVDFAQLHDYLLEPLMSNRQVTQAGITIEWLKEQAVQAGKIIEHNRWVDVANEIASGLVGLFVDGLDRALLIGALELTSREISQPVSESVARGASDAFNEDVRTSLALVRKRLRTTRLAVEQIEVGAVAKATIYIVYLKGYVYDGLVEEIKTRLSRIKTDGILSSGQIEEFINDSPWALFSGIGVTERPDRIIAALLEGRAALILGGSPFALMVPSTLNNEMQSPEDHYNRFWFGSFIRLLRWFALLTAILAPAFYVAITSYHQELIPTDLLMSLTAARAAVPFPVMIETLIMAVAFELLQEAGIRLPKPFGQTIGVVGAILVGQVAVAAGLVSPAVVLVMALTAIASYSLPSLNVSTVARILRFGFILAAGFLGLFGVIALLSVITFHLCAHRSFGVPSLSPFAPLSMSDLKDSIIRAPKWMLNLRPQQTGHMEPQRQHSDLKPRPPGDPLSGAPAPGPRNSKDSGKERG
jgi:spore germination protein KA